MQVSVMGPAIVDVLASPVSRDVFERGTYPLKSIRLSYGGNALNESVVLGRFGVETELISKVGADESGRHIIEYADRSGVSVTHIARDSNLDTGINVVLVDDRGERFFLTDPNSSLRKLSIDDLLPYVDGLASIVCFPCMFTSSLLGISEMTKLFKVIKADGDRMLILDMTTAKNNETIDDMKELFSYVDIFMPNEKELKSISGGIGTDEAAKKILSYGVKNIIVKCGSSDTRVYSAEKDFSVPTYEGAKLIDSTGAGDCFGAGLIYGLVNGFDLKEAVRFGNATASCAIESVGATDGITTVDKPMERYNSMIGSL